MLQIKIDPDTYQYKQLSRLVPQFEKGSYLFQAIKSFGYKSESTALTFFLPQPQFLK